MDKANPRKPRVLIVTCAHPSERDKARATFVHNWAQQLIYCGCDVLRSFDRQGETYARPR